MRGKGGNAYAVKGCCGVLVLCSGLFTSRLGLDDFLGCLEFFGFLVGSDAGLGFAFFDGLDIGGDLGGCVAFADLGGGVFARAVECTPAGLLIGRLPVDRLWHRFGSMEGEWCVVGAGLVADSLGKSARVRVLGVGGVLALFVHVDVGHVGGVDICKC